VFFGFSQSCTPGTRLGATSRQATRLALKQQAHMRR
jgi:hypothetical protein